MEQMDKIEEQSADQILEHVSTTEEQNPEPVKWPKRTIWNAKKVVGAKVKHRAAKKQLLLDGKRKTIAMA